MSYVIINDTHLGLKRKAGVTQASLEAYNEYQLSILDTVIERNPGKTLIFLGDLFDSGQLPYEQIQKVCEILLKHTGTLILAAGNHDLNKNLEKMSAFDFVAWFMREATVIREPYQIDQGTWVIPHLPNQTELDEAIAGAAEAGASTLLLHCNYDNGFAVEKDHSLNLSKEQAERFQHCIIAHEHNKRDLPGIDMLGAPLPCTIAECTVAKGYHLWEGPGHELEFIETWNPDGACEADWRELDDIGSDFDFIRITGKVEAEEAGLVLDTVDRFRKSSNAYMITNSVKVGELNLGPLEDSSETDLSTFDPMAALKEALSPEHRAKLEEFEKCA